MRPFGIAIVFAAAAGLAAPSAIDVAVDEQKRENHIVDSLDLLLYVALLAVTIVTIWIFRQRKVRYVRVAK